MTPQQRELNRLWEQTGYAELGICFDGTEPEPEPQPTPYCHANVLPDEAAARWAGVIINHTTGALLIGAAIALALLIGGYFAGKI